MSRLDARWIKIDQNTLMADINQNLVVKIDISNALESSSSGIRVKDLGITNNMLAGSISDDKLANAYIFANGSRAMTGNLNLGSNKIVNLADGTNPSDAATVGQLQTVASQAKIWKEALIYRGQLSSQGIHAAQVLVFTSNLENGDQIILHDGTTSETYTAGVDFPIGSTINETVSNLSNAINSGNIAVSAVSSSLQSLDPSNDVLIIWQDTVGEPTRVYGNTGSSGKIKILDPNIGYDCVASDLIYIPSSDPGSTNFGFSRFAGFIVSNETHITRESDETFTFDKDSSEWRLTGAASIPYASKTVYGKVKIGSGIGVSAGTIYITVDSPLYLDSDTIKMSINGNGLSVVGGALSLKVGHGLAFDNDGNLYVNLSDIVGSGLEVFDNKIRVSSSLAGPGLTGGSGDPLSVNAGNGLVADGNGLRLTSLVLDWNVGSSATIKLGKNPVDSADAVPYGFLQDYVANLIEQNVDSIVVEYFTLTSTDISNKYITLTNTPSISNAVRLDVKGAPPQFYNDDYIVSGNTLSWNGLGLDGLLVEGDKLRVIYPLDVNV
ncbi:MAG: hypothetical protein QXD03_02360 [Candidatus Anstonellales archaeon]